jgi:hypothetical protein
MIDNTNIRAGLASPIIEYVAEYFIKLSNAEVELEDADPMIQQFITSVIATNREWFGHMRLVNEHGFKLDQGMVSKRDHVNRGFCALLQLLKSYSTKSFTEPDQDTHYTTNVPVSEQIVTHISKVWIFVQTIHSDYDELVSNDCGEQSSMFQLCKFMVRIIQLNANPSMSISGQEVEQFLGTSFTLLYLLHPELTKNYANEEWKETEAIYKKYDDTEISISIMHVVQFVLLTLNDTSKDTHPSFKLAIPIADDILKQIPKYSIFRKADQVILRKMQVNPARPISFLLNYLEHFIQRADQTELVYTVLSLIQISLDGFIKYYLYTTTDGASRVQEELLAIVYYKYCSIIDRLSTPTTTLEIANVTTMLLMVTLLSRMTLINEYLTEEKFETAYAKLRGIMDQFHDEGAKSWLLYRFKTESVGSYVSECIPTFLYKKIHTTHKSKKQGEEVYNIANKIASIIQEEFSVYQCTSIIVKGYLMIEGQTLEDTDSKFIEGIHTFGVKVLETIHHSLALDSFSKWRSDAETFTVAVSDTIVYF